MPEIRFSQMETTIQFKINAVLFIIVTAILSGFGVNDYCSMRSRLSWELEKSANIVSERSANTLQGAMWNVTKKKAETAIDIEMSDRRVLEVIARENDGRTLFFGKTRKDASNRINFDGRPPGSFVCANKIVEMNNQHLGFVEVCLTTDLMNRELNKSVAEIAVRDEEYGAGFSIVASEVGNLAKRTAGVAKTTAERIRETVKKTIQADTEKAVRTASASQNMNLRSERMRRMTNKLASISSH